MHKRIVLTGGHAATTALAVIEELIKQNRNLHLDIYWIGAKSGFEGKHVPTLESKIFPKIGVFVYPIISGKIQTKFTFWTIPALIKIPFGFLHALVVVYKIKPRVILSFGGSASVPVVVAGWLMRVPVIIHEQVAGVGRANKFSSFFAKKIALAREESKKFFPPEKTFLVGNPILSQIKEITPKMNLGNPPTIFVTGGSRGSQRLNEFVEPILERLLTKYKIIHQCGFIDFEKFKKKKESLRSGLKEKYDVYDLIDPMKIDNVYREADLIVGRAGANTVSEIIATKRPALLIPIPWTYNNEQTKNALFAQRFGIAKILEQETLTPDKLMEEIDLRIGVWDEIVKGVQAKESPDINAAERLVRLLKEYI